MHRSCSPRFAERENTKTQPMVMLRKVYSGLISIAKYRFRARGSGWRDCLSCQALLDSGERRDCAGTSRYLLPRAQRRRGGPREVLCCFQACSSPLGIICRTYLIPSCQQREKARINDVGTWGWPAAPVGSPPVPSFLAPCPYLIPSHPHPLFQHQPPSAQRCSKPQATSTAVPSVSQPEGIVRIVV